MTDRTDDAASCYRFAVLADPHLTSLDRVRPRELMNKRLLTYLSWWRRRRFAHSGDVLAALMQDLAEQDSQHVVVAGDLTNLGTPCECREALAWLHRIGPPTRVTVVAGNHDFLVRAPWADTVGQWRDFMGSDDAPADAAHLPIVRRRGPVALIGVNTARPTAPFLASGRIGVAALERLGELLHETAGEGRCRVLVMHHPPCADAVSRRRALDDGAALRGLLRTVGAELVLHGHAHELAMSTLPGPHGAIPVISVPPASATTADPRHAAAYYLVQIERSDGGVMPRWRMHVTARCFDAARQCFRDRHLPAMCEGAIELNVDIAGVMDV